SWFDKEIVDTYLYTLANTPILAFIEENSSGEIDFSDHRLVLEHDEEGKVKLAYKGQAIGIIPESNNAKWETRVTDSGEELEYLTVEGLIWTKWDDPVDIMNRKGFTSQSMELHDEYEGYWDDNGVFHFTKFSFYGACLLGDDVFPAMKSSTAELQFSSNKNIQKTIEDKLEEFKSLFSKKGGKNVEDVKQEFEEQVTETTESEVVETEMQVAEVIEEEVMETEGNFEQVQEVTAQQEESETTVTEFALTHSQIENQLRQLLSTEKYIDRWGDSCRKYWYVDRTNSQVIVENTQEGYQLYAFNYAINGDNVEVQFDTGIKVKIEYVPFEGESVAFTSQIERFGVEKELLDTELTELKSYKRQREEQDLASKFADKLSENEIKEVFEATKDSSLDVVEEKLLATFGKKNFSLAEEKPSSKVKLNINKTVEQENPYKDFFS
ncbi:hypothetical protein D7X33_20945, partial [Butyricicoccus sp. 1XD8-22]